jgi:endoribonuclease Dicer
MYEPTNQQPLPDILFQAITRRSSGEQMDNENFEVLGDCFLKLAVSMSLYNRYPLESAGVLTEEKKKQISNENLYRLAVQKELKTYLNVKKIVFRGKDANWLPPGYTIDETKMVIGERYTHQNAKRKAFSDMIEALIGAFLISSNYTTTIEFMDWLGLDVIPKDGKGRKILKDTPVIFVVLS